MVGQYGPSRRYRFPAKVLKAAELVLSSRESLEGGEIIRQAGDAHVAADSSSFGGLANGHGWDRIHRPRRADP